MKRVHDALAAPGGSHRSLPRRVVALGGGTGLPAVLRGLRSIVDVGPPDAITAIVAMSDDGGSSGRLRRSMGLPPPGDVRNCLVALAEEEDLLAELFQHRYESCSELGGHTAGNLILAALAEQTGSFLKAVELSSHVLRTVGRILPVTQEDVVLEAELTSGEVVAGETNIAELEGQVSRVRLRPEDASAAPEVVEAIMTADLVVLGPGSLYTSVLPNIAVSDVAGALRRTTAAIVWVANLVGERPETAGLDLHDHLRAIEEHAGGPVVAGALVHSGPIRQGIVERYLAEGTAPLTWRPIRRGSVEVVERNLISTTGPKLRHDSSATAAGLIELFNRLRSRAEVNEAS